MATHIEGLDNILEGGLPKGRMIAITGGPGAGKTLLAMQIMANRAIHHKEASVVISFEESPERLRQNFASLRWNLGPLWNTHLRLVDGRPPSDISVSGDFDLAGLLAIVDSLCEESGARTVVLDGLDALIACLPGDQRGRQELSRIARWNSDRGLTCIVTVKGAHDTPASHYEAEFLHYITDCVIELEARVYGSVLARTLRVMKYRGSGFAGNAFPAVLSGHGFEIISSRLPRLGYPTFCERLSTGIPSLDEVLGGGLRRGTSTLISGAPGTAKTVLCGHIAAAACARGEKVLFISFDQGDTQVVSDLASVGIDLRRWVESGQLIIMALRSGTRSPEEHLSNLRSMIVEAAPDTLIIDPVSALSNRAYPFCETISETLVDDARERGISFTFTSLTGGVVGEQEVSISNISTVADTWLHLSYNVVAGERNRAISIVKSRGTGHSNQLHELVLSDDGLHLVAPYSAEGAVLMGSARVQKQMAEESRRRDADAADERRVLELKHRFMRLENALALAQNELQWTRNEIEMVEADSKARASGAQQAMARRLEARHGHVETGRSDP